MQLFLVNSTNFLIIYLLIIFIYQAQTKPPSLRKNINQNEGGGEVPRMQRKASNDKGKNGKQLDALVIRRACGSFNFMGSNLFDGNRKICFSQEDVHLLLARRNFELMVPQKMPPGLLDDRMAGIIIRYFCNGYSLVQYMPPYKNSAARIMRKAYCDTLGGFFHHSLLPMLRLSYYAGKLDVRTVYLAMAQYEKCRVFLNTNGNGWKAPLQQDDLLSTQLKGVSIEPLILESGQGENKLVSKTCGFLDLTGSHNNKAELIDDRVLVALPKIDFEDDNGDLSNVWLPFNRKRIFNLRSKEASYVLVKFYKTVSGCYVEKGMPLVYYDRQFKQWITDNINDHLTDERFYPGLGGVLRIYATLTEANRVADQSCPTVDTNRNGPCGDKANLPGFIKVDKSKSQQLDCSRPCDEHWLDKIFPLDKKKEKKVGKPKAKKKKSWFNFGNWFKFNKGDKSKKDSNWWRWLKKILKYVIIAIVVALVLYLLCKFCGCFAAMGCEGAGSILGNCCQIVFKFLVTVVKLLGKLLVACCSWLCRCICNRSESPKKDVAKPGNQNQNVVNYNTNVNQPQSSRNNSNNLSPPGHYPTTGPYQHSPDNRLKHGGGKHEELHKKNLAHHKKMPHHSTPTSHQSTPTTISTTTVSTTSPGLGEHREKHQVSFDKKSKKEKSKKDKSKKDKSKKDKSKKDESKDSWEIESIKMNSPKKDKGKKDKFKKNKSKKASPRQEPPKINALENDILKTDALSTLGDSSKKTSKVKKGKHHSPSGSSRMHGGSSNFEEGSGISFSTISRPSTSQDFNARQSWQTFYDS